MQLTAANFPAADISQTTLTWEQAAYAATAALTAQQRNADLQYKYDQAIRDFDANMESGQKHDPPLVPPVAPRSYVISPPDDHGLVFAVQAGPPLTPTPPLKIDTVDLGTLAPQAKVPGVIHVTRVISGSWYGVGADDGNPSGFMTPPGTKSDDGSTGVFEKFGAPVGNGWYLKVA